MTLKIMDDRIQLEEPNQNMMRQQSGRTTRSEIVTFSGRQVGRPEAMRKLALSIRNLNQVRVSIPVVSETYDWAGWCDVMSASASTREFTKAEDGHPGTTVVTWSITLERIEGQQEVRLLGRARPHTGDYTATPKIGLPNEAEGTFFPKAITNPPASTLETFGGLSVRRWSPNFEQITSGLRYTLDPRLGHYGQVKLNLEGHPTVGLQPHTRSPSKWDITNGMITVESVAGSTFRIRCHKTGGGWINVLFGALVLPDDISVIYNTYFMTVIGLNYTVATSTTQVRILMRRGDTNITVEIVGLNAAFQSTGWHSVLGGRGHSLALTDGVGTLVAQAFGSASDRRYGITQDTGGAEASHKIWLAGVDQWVRMVQL